jgi:hypothetical protein
VIKALLALAAFGAHTAKCANGCGRDVPSPGQVCNVCRAGR